MEGRHKTKGKTPDIDVPQLVRRGQFHAGRVPPREQVPLAQRHVLACILACYLPAASSGYRRNRIPSRQTPVEYSVPTRDLSFPSPLVLSSLRVCRTFHARLLMRIVLLIVALSSLFSPCFVMSCVLHVQTEPENTKHAGNICAALRVQVQVIEGRMECALHSVIIERHPYSTAYATRQTCSKIMSPFCLRFVHSLALSRFVAPARCLSLVVCRLIA